MAEFNSQESARDTARTDNIQADSELCQRFLNGDPEAGQEFYDRYHRLAHHFGRKAVARSRSGAIDSDDLSQEALIHFMEKAPQYDESRHTSFSTFASTYVNRRLQRVLDGQYGTHVPGNIASILRQVNAINDYRMRNRLSIMTDEDISTEFNIPVGPANDLTVTVGAIRQAMLLTSYLGSIDNGFSPHTDHSPGNEYVIDEMSSLKPINSEDVQTVEDKALYPILKNILGEALQILTEREERVIRLRFGFDDGTPKTLDEIGKTLGLTREKIRQLESKAMRNLRQYYHSNPARAQDFI